MAFKSKLQDFLENVVYSDYCDFIEGKNKKFKVKNKAPSHSSVPKLCFIYTNASQRLIFFPQSGPHGHPHDTYHHVKFYTKRFGFLWKPVDGTGILVSVNKNKSVIPLYTKNKRERDRKETERKNQKCMGWLEKFYER